MSQRVMIDHYILLGFLLLIVLQKAPKLLQRGIVIVFGLLLMVNIIQTAQIKKGIYKMGSPTKEIYWDNFLRLNRKAKVYEKVGWQLIEQRDVSFNPASGLITKGIPKEGAEKYFIQTNELEVYSPSFIVNLSQPTHKIVVSFNTLSQTEILESRFVLTTVEETPQSKVIYLKDFMVLNSKTQMEYLIEFSVPITSFEAYFWNGNTNEIVDYSDFKVESYQ